MNRYRRFLLPLALLLPLAGLALIWLQTERESHQGSEWDVPIAGYDPRDLLRGHYVQFRYDWPAVAENDIPTWYGLQTGLCLTGNAPDIERVEIIDRAEYDSSPTPVCDAIARVNPWSEEGTDGLVRDRIYIPQQAARDYTDKLANPALQGVVRIRSNNSGFITPLSLRFRSRPAENEAREDAE
jgi:hypothetical protein